MMTEAAAKEILTYGLAGGVAFWFVGILMWRKLHALPPTWSRTIEVSGRKAAEAVDALIPFFAQGGMIKERTAARVTLDSRVFSILITGADRADGARLEVTLDYSQKKGMRLWMGILVWILQPLVIFGLYLLLWMLVAPSEEPAMRGQCWQIFQMIHVLWPPFLIYFMARKIRSMGEVLVGNMASFLQRG